MTSLQRRSRALLGCIFALASTSCGAAEHVEYEFAPAEEAPLAAVQTNACPAFGWWLLLPRRLALGETTEILVNVSDPDAPDGNLAFDWVASHGAFSDPHWNDTAYTCEREGSQALTLKVRDESDCTSELTLDVECLLP